MDLTLLRPQQEALGKVGAAGVADRVKEPALLRLPLGCRRLPRALLHRIERLFPESEKQMFQKDLLLRNLKYYI